MTKIHSNSLNVTPQNHWGVMDKYAGIEKCSGYFVKTIMIDDLIADQPESI